MEGLPLLKNLWLSVLLLPISMFRNLRLETYIPAGDIGFTQDKDSGRLWLLGIDGLEDFGMEYTIEELLIVDRAYGPLSVVETGLLLLVLSGMSYYLLISI